MVYSSMLSSIYLIKSMLIAQTTTLEPFYLRVIIITSPKTTPFCLICKNILTFYTILIRKSLPLRKRSSLFIPISDKKSASFRRIFPDQTPAAIRSNFPRRNRRNRAVILKRSIEKGAMLFISC